MRPLVTYSYYFEIVSTVTLIDSPTEFISGLFLCNTVFIPGIIQKMLSVVILINITTMDAYFWFSILRFVHCSGNTGAVLLANPTQISHWFATRIWGRSLIHKSAKVVNATGVIPLASQDSSYKDHTFCCKYANVNIKNICVCMHTCMYKSCYNHAYHTFCGK